MARTIAIGIQDFEKVRVGNYFYIDKTAFIKEWWESGDDVTLITRPRRFGKTLNMSMLEQFFSVDYAGISSSSGIITITYYYEEVVTPATETTPAVTEKKSKRFTRKVNFTEGNQ